MKLHLPLFLSSVPLSFGWHQGVGHHGHKQHDQSLRTPKLRWLFKLCNQRKQKFSRGTKQHHKACVFSLSTSPLGHEGWGCLKNPAFLTQHTNQEAIPCPGMAAYFAACIHRFHCRNSRWLISHLPETGCWQKQSCWNFFFSVCKPLVFTKRKGRERQRWGRAVAVHALWRFTPQCPDVLPPMTGLTRSTHWTC